MEKQLTCADCEVVACKRIGATYPAFCPSRDFDLADEQWLQDEMRDEDTWRILEASAISAYEAYDDKLSRLAETIIFARELGAKRIGIAGCSTLAKEVRKAARAFREQGFEVIGAMCKIGAMTNDELGLTVPRRTGRQTVLCNPIYQAKVLNDADTDLNVVIGLCAGHDGLFVRHSDALCTMLVVKDFKNGHCPIHELRE